MGGRGASSGMGKMSALEGTEKQVKWANDIRNGWIIFLEYDIKRKRKKGMKTARREAWLKYLLSQTQAKWFINHRDTSSFGSKHVTKDILKRAYEGDGRDYEANDIVYATQHHLTSWLANVKEIKWK